jgi:imidazoleglycerol-phosphate dehydratase
MRRATVKRTTRETRIQVTVDLDGTGQHDIATGIGFLDHMLAHVALHGLLDLTVQAQGDLEVDAHHTVEDVALVLGQAIDEALGERKGIVRMASFHVTMDDSLCFVAMDLSGRPYSVTDVSWHGPSVGELPTALVEHFFRSMAQTLRANLHARVLYGSDDHHQAEGLFKALGRVLGEATRFDARRAGAVPSTKGTL